MRLTSFQVQGYKNLQRPVRLTELGALNVVHGANNSGKSNLMEAIGLLFALLERLFAVSPDDAYDRHRSPSEAEKDISVVGPAADAMVARTFRGDTMRAIGFPPEEIFNFTNPAPIQLTGDLAFDREELESTSQLAQASLTATITFHMVQRGGNVRVRLVHVILEGQRLTPEAPFLRELSSYLSRRRIDGIDGASAPLNRGGFELLKVDRGLAYRAPPLESAEPRGPRALIPPDLALALFDAKEVQPQRWDSFVRAISQFSELLPGQPDLSFKRRENRAEIIFTQTNKKPIPSHLLGSGVQQIINLLGRLVMTDSALLAIEEPELNINYSLQRKLLPALRTLIGGETGPQQLFLTSHSNAFEEPGDAFFYGLVLHEDGPEVQRRPAGDADLFTGQYPVALPEERRAPLSYVTREGLVRVPEDVLKRMSLENGGGVFFADDQRTGYTWVLNDQQFLALFDRKQDSGND